MRACLADPENEAWFYAIAVGGAGEDVVFYPHVIASTGRYLAPLAGISVGAAMAYLIAPPLESIVGLDAACKAANVRLAKWFGPPSETNFGGGYLVGDQTACEAAATAFASAIADVCAAPIADARGARRRRRRSRREGRRSRTRAAGRPTPAASKRWPPASASRSSPIT